MMHDVYCIAFDTLDWAIDDRYSALPDITANISNKVEAFPLISQQRQIQGYQQPE